MKGYGLAALAPLATVYPLPLSGGTGDPGVPGRGTETIATANHQIELPEFDPKSCLNGLRSFSEFLLLTGQQHADVRTNVRSSKTRAKKIPSEASEDGYQEKLKLGRLPEKTGADVYSLRNGPDCPNGD